MTSGIRYWTFTNAALSGKSDCFQFLLCASSDLVFCIVLVVGICRHLPRQVDHYPVKLHHNYSNPITENPNMKNTAQLGPVRANLISLLLTNHQPTTHSQPHSYHKPTHTLTHLTPCLTNHFNFTSIRSYFYSYTYNNIHSYLRSPCVWLSLL